MKTALNALAGFLVILVLVLAYSDRRANASITQPDYGSVLAPQSDDALVPTFALATAYDVVFTVTGGRDPVPVLTVRGLADPREDTRKLAIRRPDNPEDVRIVLTTRDGTQYTARWEKVVK